MRFTRGLRKVKKKNSTTVRESKAIGIEINKRRQKNPTPVIERKIRTRDIEESEHLCIDVGGGVNGAITIKIIEFNGNHEEFVDLVNNDCMRGRPI
jgi:hypothetical protein